jgi:hypothetical protein
MCLTYLMLQRFTKSIRHEDAFVFNQIWIRNDHLIGV